MNRVYAHLVKDEQSLSFDAIEYSNFKHGDVDLSIKFGKELANALVLSTLKEVNKDELIYITGAPYNEVPVASTILATYTAMYLRLAGYTNIKEFKINRQHSYHDDYGLKSAEERKSSITGESFTMDTDIFMQTPNIIFVDDILITGAHESRIVDMLDYYGINVIPKYIFAYFAYLEPNCCSPDIEHTLNTAGFELDTEYPFFNIFANKRLALNTRACKLILKMNPEVFTTIYEYFWHESLIELFRYALANNYHSHELYSQNFKALKKYLHGLN